MTRLAAALTAVLLLAGTARAAEDLHTRMMLCTFKLTDGRTSGTSFVLHRPLGEGRFQTVLVTAAHVLEHMPGDEATLVARGEKDDRSYEKLPVKIRIRAEGKPLWKQHPSEDVAVLAVALPDEVKLSRVSTELLANDELLARYEIHPGERLFCAGYPHAEQFEPSAAGFPIVRAGCLASFPLLPTAATKTFLFDFNTFEGDSGGAVYLSQPNRYYKGQTHAEPVELILGVVHGQHFIDEAYKMIYQSGKTRHRMGLSIIVHASAVRATLDQLPRVTE
jgi:hypothetical protein